MTDQRNVPVSIPGEAQIECQIHCLPRMQDPNAEVILPPLFIHWRLKITRRLDHRTKRTIMRYLNRLLSGLSTLIGRSQESSAPATKAPTTNWKAGDLVRVRSREEIEATLDRWRKVKGCTFIEEMVPYCGTTQRVLKPVERFLDERDHKLKRCRGIILLDGLLCQGTKKFGACDRSCFLFWREEWLEKIDEPGA